MIAPGAISAEHMSRRFVVRARDTQTLKELLVARGRTGAQEVWALREIDLTVAPGEAVALVGRNGSGKSTLLRVLAGIIKPTSGTVATAGRIGSLLELGAGFHPDFTGRENVELNGALQGLTRARIKERFDEIVAFAELEHAIDRPVRTYSSGMTMRLGFAIAAFLEADILLLDEVFAVGDESFQRKCFGVISAFKQRGGTILFVSHDASAVERLCERAVVLRDGRCAFDGPVHDALTHYRRILAEDTVALAAVAGVEEAITEQLDAEIVAARLTRDDGSTAERFVAGDGITLHVAIRAVNAIEPPVLQLELRDVAGLLVADERVDLAAHDWAVAAGHRAELSFELPDPVLQFGRFRVALNLLTAGDELLHRHGDVLPLLVYPDDAGRGLIRLAGTWTTSANDVSR